MRKHVIFGLLLVAFTMPVASRADENPTYKGAMSPSELTFVHSIQADLNQRFPHAADAVKAGYVRYTNADSTGAISYANMRWASADIRHPSQLWFDKHGNLLGADYSELDTNGVRPKLFGVNPGRWYQFDDHIHWVGKDPATGKFTYDNYAMAPAFVKAGGDLKNPSADVLVKMKKAKTTSSVVTVFDFPKVWDLIVWTKPNPKGAFAEKNPNVIP